MRLESSYKGLTKKTHTYSLVLLVKRNTLVLYSYFHRTFIMFLLLVSVTFYRCIEKRHSKSFLPHFSTFVEILLKSGRKITADIHL